MENTNVSHLIKALGLKRQIVGVRFLAYKKEMESSAGKYLSSRTFCGLVYTATQGQIVKADQENLSCRSAAYALGIVSEPEFAYSGRMYGHSGLYASQSIAREVNDAMKHIPHKICGVEVGPLDKMKNADLIIIICNCKQAMRLMQGYAYGHGPAENLGSIGNQAMCSDLAAKPFMNHDINISLMCCGTRAAARCEEGEMGVSMPIDMFDSVVNGVIQTLNLTENNKAKKEILARLDNPDELGISVIMNYSYGTTTESYIRYCKKREAEEI